MSSDEREHGRLVRRTFLAMIPALAVANAIGAAVVVVLAGWVIPQPDLDDTGRVIAANAIAATIYLFVALVVGFSLGVRRFRRVRRLFDRPGPLNPRDQQLVLRTPRYIAGMHAMFWIPAAAIFAAVNASFDPIMLLTVGTTTLLGGVTTIAFVFLLSERLLRKTAAAALDSGAPERRTTPGVTSRAVLAWALGSGVPVAGIVLVGLAQVTGIGDETDANDMAITMLGLGGVALLAGLGLTLFGARQVAGPLGTLRSAVRRIGRGDYDFSVPVYDGGELGLLQAGVNDMVGGLRERDHLRDLFGRHVGDDVVRHALKRGVDLGGETRDVAVLFVDVIESTALATERPPGEVVTLLNEFFAVVHEVVDARGGWINKFEGDAAVAIFGAPVDVDDAAGCALAAARTLATRLAQSGGLRAGIGVSAGEVLAGNVGDEQRFEYTVIGDPVNEAARLTELSKERSHHVLASESALQAAGPNESEHWAVGETVRLRGRSTSSRLAQPR